MALTWKPTWRQWLEDPAWIPLAENDDGDPKPMAKRWSRLSGWWSHANASGFEVKTSQGTEKAEGAAYVHNGFGKRPQSSPGLPLICVNFIVSNRVEAAVSGSKWLSELTQTLHRSQSGSHPSPRIPSWDGRSWHLLLSVRQEDWDALIEAFNGLPDQKLVVGGAGVEIEVWAGAGECRLQNIKNGKLPSEVLTRLLDEQIPALALDRLLEVLPLSKNLRQYAIATTAWASQIRIIRQALRDHSEQRDEEGVPMVFNSNGQLARMREGAIFPLTAHTLGRVLDEAGRWITGAKGAPTSPHLNAVKAVIQESPLKLPRVESIVRCPVVLPGPRLLDKPDYIEDQGILSRVRGLPEMDLEEAKEVLDEAFGDFFYDGGKGGQAHANAMAALFTIPLRFMESATDMPSPMFAFTKPKPRTGASALMNCIAMLTLGQEMAPSQWSSIPGEVEKVIASRFLEGASALFFDNVINPTPSPAMSTLITLGITGIRQLGVNKTITNKGPVTAFLTANSAELPEDYHTRICQVELVPTRPISEDTDLSRVFTHHPIEDYVRNNLRSIQAAMCSVLRASLPGLEQANEPRGSRFPRWEGVTNVVLDVLGLPPVKVGVLAGGSITTKAEVERRLIQVVTECGYGESNALKRDDLVRAFAWNDDAARLPGVAGVAFPEKLEFFGPPPEIPLRPPWSDGNLRFKSGGDQTLGQWLGSIVRGKVAAPAGPPQAEMEAVLKGDHQVGQRRRYWAEFTLEGSHGKA